MNRPAFGLRRRIVVAFLVTVAGVCLLFSLLALTFAYVAEDRMFGNILTEETRLQQDHWRAHGELTRPLRDYVEIHRDTSNFPEDLRARYGGEEGHREFAGADNRHYEILRFELPGNAGSAFAVAEVSLHLVVRPLRSELLTFLLVSTLFVLAVAGLVGFLLARQAVAPLTRLAERVASIDERQIPDVKADDYPCNEVGILATALDSAFNRIRSLVAREARFTRDASHELRTPLAIIRSSAELISLHPALASELAPPLGRLQAAALDMEETIELLLALAREENSLSRKQVQPLLPFIETAVLRASQRFGRNSADLVIDVPASRQVAANPAILTMILTNIVGNAFQHARGSEVMIRSDGSTLEIADSGPGMPAEAVDGLFTEFAKGDSSEGHGLGLSIVQRLCSNEGIGLEVVTSSSPGTTVTLDFEESAAKRD